MRKCLYILFVILFAAGCCRQVSPKEVLAKVNNYEITKDEFADEFKDYARTKADTPQARKEFLDNLINRKLILQDAEKKGLDKEPHFLKMIQHFWEQSLLKIAVEKKINETAASSAAGARLTKEAEERALNEWMEGLKSKADIKIDHKLLEG